MKTITSFERITLSITGMRAFTEEYEIVKTESGVTLSRYEGSWRYDDSQNREDCLVARLEGDEALYAQILTKLNEFKIAKWDGFQKSNKYMLDGYMFLFEASVNSGSRIRAEGSNAYPKHYRAFLDYLSTTLPRK